MLGGKVKTAERVNRVEMFSYWARVERGGKMIPHECESEIGPGPKGIVHLNLRAISKSRVAIVEHMKKKRKKKKEIKGQVRNRGQRLVTLVETYKEGRG